MKVIAKIKGMQKYADKARQEGKTIGLVPTMGYLHKGHLSLVKKAREECDIVVTSIFVNPTQFAPGEDLEEYPRDFKRDKKLLQKEKCDVIFRPSVKEMYPEEKLTWVTVDKISRKLCGLSRPTHFQGVTTIVSKLFNAVKPHKAYFGQKDYQQSLVIRKMVKDLNIDIEIVTCPIVREKDGIAMSSRNIYLSKDERKQALVLSQSLKKAEELINKGEKNPEKIKQTITGMIKSKPSAKIDYVEILNAGNLENITKIKGRIVIALAVYIGKTRLIDNIMIK